MHSEDLPLAGLKVVELNAIGPVPFVGLQLQQLGASVVRICPPVDRAIGIDISSEADLLNNGKSQHAINLKDEAGLAQLHTLLNDADVLIEGFRPGVMERLALAPTGLLERYPRLIVARLSGFGRHGEYASRAGHDINYLALSGALAAIGTSDTPVVPLNLIADFGGGAMYLLNGILARLVQRGISGSGGIVSTSILAGTVGLTTMMHSLLADERWSLTRQQNLLDGGLPFYRVYRTLDNKFMAVGALEQIFFNQLLILIELEHSISVDKQYDRSTWNCMTRRFSQAFLKRTRQQWTDEALKLDCCVTPVLDFAEAAVHPHNNANKWFNTTPFPHPGHILQFNEDRT